MSTTVTQLPWRRLSIGPALLFVGALLLFVAFDLDRRVADALYNSSTGFPFQRSDSYEFWAHWLPRKLAAFTFFALVLTLLIPRAGKNWRDWYLPLWLGVFAMLTATSLIGHLKASTGIYCPLQHAQYGGSVHEDYVGPLPLRIDEGGRCWPAGHATNGLAFIALYFSFLMAGRQRLARFSLATALIAGQALGLSQVVRGHHFLSHQLWSTAICWFVPLLLFWLYDRLRSWQEQRSLR